jgi:phosphoribosylanthranilate isomerase
LNPDNILEVLREYNPYIVDLSSGLEKEPGIKDHNKIKKFFKEIEAYEFGG